MNKIKVTTKSGIAQLMIKSLKGQQINENEVYAINSNRVSGLLRLEVIQKGTSFKLTYNITGFISLKDFLKTPLNKENFARLLQSILGNLKSMDNSYFNQEYLLMDFSKVMVNPATQSIYFVYVPIKPFENNGSLRDFLLNIIQYSSFEPGEDMSYVRDYINILNNGINFSIFDLEQYINKLLGKEDIIKPMVIECPQCHNQVSRGTNYCSICGAKIHGNTGSTDEGKYNPLENYKKRFMEKQEDKEDKEHRQKQEQRQTQGLSDGTTVLGENNEGTVVLGSEELYKPHYPFLIREKNEEKILIDKPSFRIGKEKKYSDYFVFDNNAVSRSHADIITREKRYFVVDLNSTNKTYIDGRAIPVDVEVELFSGSRLRLANEEFIFFIE